MTPRGMLWKWIGLVVIMLMMLMLRGGVYMSCLKDIEVIVCFGFTAFFA